MSRMVRDATTIQEHRTKRWFVAPYDSGPTEESAQYMSLEMAIEELDRLEGLARSGNGVDAPCALFEAEVAETIRVIELTKQEVQAIGSSASVKWVKG